MFSAILKELHKPAGSNFKYQLRGQEIISTTAGRIASHHQATAPPAQQKYPSLTFKISLAYSRKYQQISRIRSSKTATSNRKAFKPAHSIVNTDQGASRALGLLRSCIQTPEQKAASRADQEQTRTNNSAEPAQTQLHDTQTSSNKSVKHHDLHLRLRQGGKRTCTY